MLFIRFAWLASLLAASSGFLTTPSSRRSLSGTCLNSKHKDSDRARMERMLEKSMGNDWRYFRAQLVAQEKAAEEANSKVKANSNTNVNAKKRAKPARRRRVVTNPERPLKSQRKVRPVTSSSPPVGRRSSRILLLDDKIGKPGDLAKEMMCLGAPAISAAPAKKIRRRRRRLSGSLGVKQGKLFFSDPFVSAAELPIHITSEGRTVDKHRWAYPVESIEVGCVLIANEKMRGDFKRAVVLVVNHGEKGTSGVVINR